MVRPVEPEPPDALRRINDRVKRADATPDKLGHQQVKERQQKSGQHHEKKQDQRVETDEVIIASGQEEAASDDAKPTQEPVKPADEDSDDIDHVDVKV